MTSKKKRNLLLNVNRLQASILYPIYTACIIALVITILCLISIYILDVSVENVFNLERSTLKLVITKLVVLMALVLLIVIVWTYVVSNKMVGAHDRVVRELDLILEGKKKTPIASRKGDPLFADILHRINELIKRLG